MFSYFLSFLWFNVYVSKNIRYFNYQKVLSTMYVDGVERPRCSAPEIGPSKLTYLTSSQFENGTNEGMCQFSPSLKNCLEDQPGSLKDCRFDEWFCKIGDKERCDGISICLFDECNCPVSDVDIFFCSDSKGCIDLKLTCDGIYDCLDKSDEMICDELVEFSCQLQKHYSTNRVINETFSLSKLLLCSETSNWFNDQYLSINCDKSSCKASNYSVGKTIGNKNGESCFYNMLDIVEEMGSAFKRWSVNFTEICLNHCNNLLSAETCSHFNDSYMPGQSYAFHCGASEGILQEIGPMLVCDGVVDCRDQSDELNCLERFYCSEHDKSKAPNDVSWVAESAVCNSYKDCDNGRDECLNCSNDLLSSDQFIVKNHGIFAWLVMSCFLIFYMNAWAVWKIVPSVWINQQTHVEVDKILQLQTCFYDSIMGSYLFILVIANIRFYGNYCMFDHAWRSGWACKGLGIIYNFSTHGSLLTVFLMCLTRAYKCSYSYSPGISLRQTIILSVLLALCNLAHSVLPVIPSDVIQDIFRLKMTFSQSNPFITHNFENLSHVDRIYHQYYGENSLDLGIHGKLEALKLITNRPELFRYNELSFYSWSPVCVQDLYGYRESLSVYKLIYITFIVFTLLAIACLNFIIVNVVIRSKLKVNPSSNNDRINDIKAKVSVIIGTKVFTWLTIIVVMIYYNFTRKYVPDGWFEVTALCIMPANSLLNPLLNSGLTEIIVKSLCVKCLKRPEQQRVEMGNIRSKVTPTADNTSINVIPTAGYTKSKVTPATDDTRSKVIPPAEKIGSKVTATADDSRSKVTQAINDTRNKVTPPADTISKVTSPAENIGSKVIPTADSNRSKVTPSADNSISK